MKLNEDSENERRERQNGHCPNRGNDERTRRGVMWGERTIRKIGGRGWGGNDQRKRGKYDEG